MNNMMIQIRFVFSSFHNTQRTGCRLCLLIQDINSINNKAMAHTMNLNSTKVQTWTLAKDKIVVFGLVNNVAKDVCSLGIVLEYVHAICD